MKAISTLASDEFISSDVGFIPKSWQCQPLRSLLIESPKYGINAPAVALESDIPVYIRITDISEDGYFRPGEKVGVRSPISHLYRLQEGDIVLARTGASVGKSYLYNADDGELVYAGFLIKVSCDQSLFLPRFLRHFLHTEFFWSWVKVNSMRSGQPGINGNEFARLPIPVPPLSEQTAIANALSDVDALIQELEKLIAKKQAIKTATMQQLLTGRTRLPQFANHPDGRKKGYKPSELGEIPEDWEIVRLGDVGETIIGLTYSPNDVAEYGTLVLRSSNVQQGKLAYSDCVYVNMSLPDRVIVREGDILVCVRNGSRQLIGKCALIDKKAEGHAFGAFMSIYRTQYSKFVFYQFQSDLIQSQINEMMGATINQITNKDMASFLIGLPCDPKEQTEIAQICSDIDEEIQALEQRLSKTRQIKQGMMQELLTGKTRLVKPVGAAE
jgi:type I restriction enzyme S subunit